MKTSLLSRLTILTALVGTTGCSSWMASLKSGILGDDDATAVAATKSVKRAPASVAPAADDTPAPTVRRKADPFDGTGPVNEGSLWDPEAQDNFYFSKNLMHKVGDLLVVKMEPEVSDALNLRIAAVVGRSSVQQVVADEAGKAVGTAVEQKVGDATGNANIAKAVGAAATDRAVASLDEKPRYVDLDEVSVRIAEVLPRNAYRIEGGKRITIRNSPYQLKYSGVVRDEDIGAGSIITSSKVIDSRLEMAK